MHSHTAHGHVVYKWFVPTTCVFETNRFIFLSLLVLAWELLLSQQQLRCPILQDISYLGHWVTPSRFNWESLTVCSCAHHEPENNNNNSKNNNKVCLCFPASHFSCRRSLQCIRIKIMRSLALLLEGRQHSAGAARNGTPVPGCRTCPIPWAGGSWRKENNPEPCLWCPDGPCLPKLLHRRNLHFLQYMVLYTTQFGNISPAYPGLLFSTSQAFISSWRFSKFFWESCFPNIF